MNKGEYKNEGRTVMHAVDEQCIQLTEARALRQPPSVSRHPSAVSQPAVTARRWACRSGRRQGRRG